MDTSTLIDVVEIIDTQIAMIDEKVLDTNGGTETEAIGSFFSRRSLLQLRNHLQVAIDADVAAIEQ